MIITKVSLFMYKRSLSSYFIKLANHENPMAFSCSGILCIIKIISIFFLLPVAPGRIMMTSLELLKTRV